MEEPQQRGPSWYDVHEALRRLERTHSLHASFRIGAQVSTKTRRSGLWVSLELTRDQQRLPLNEMPILYSDWPHVDHKTMPGLMLKLLHIADNRLEEWRERKEKTSQTALPF